MKVRFVNAMAALALGVVVLGVAPASASAPAGPVEDLVPPVEIPALPGAVPAVPAPPPLVPQLGLSGASDAPAAPPAQPVPGTPPSPATSDSATAPVESEAATAAAPRSLIGREHIQPTGSNAVLKLARSSTALLALLLAAVAFLLVQGRVDRRSPSLASAPLDRSDELLEFS